MNDLKDIKFYKQNKYAQYDLENTVLPKTYKEGIVLKCVKCASNYLSAFICRDIECPLYELKKRIIKKPHKASNYFLNNRINIKDNTHKGNRIYYVYKITFTDGSLYAGLNYIGKHAAIDIDDGYICSSSLVKSIIAKGEPYTRTILRIFDNDYDANIYEKLKIATTERILNKEKLISIGKYKQYKTYMEDKYSDIII